MLDFVLSSPCNVDRAIIGGGIFFDVFVVIATTVFLLIYSRLQKKFLYHYFAVMVGVFIFEMFTSPLWNNPHLGTYAYVYKDVSWVLTFGWATLILSVVVLVDTVFSRLSEIKRFVLYIVGMAFFGFLAEAMVLFLGLRTYSQEVLNILWGFYVWNVPIEVFYYIPVFSALIIGFYKYWAKFLDNTVIAPEKKIRWGKSLAISAVAVLLFELMVEPMAINSHMPSWSYIYQDISVIMTGVWIIIIWLSTKLVDKYFIHYDLKKRFGLYMLVGGGMSILLESFYVVNGFRSYAQSVQDNFVGWHTPLTDLPIEIVFAMPMYIALMIGFIRFWELITSTRKNKHETKN